MSSTGSTALSPAELDRRERNRSKVRRSYYRKIYNLNELRAQMVTLEDEYERLLQAQEARAAFHAAQTLDCDSDEAESWLDLTLEPLEDLEALDALEPVDPAPVLLEAPSSGREKRLLQLARVRKSLYQENESLRGREMAFAKAYGSLQHLMDVRTEDDEHDKVELRRTQLMVGRRFTISECLEINRLAYGRIMAFLEKQRHKPPTGTTLGWTDRRRLSDGMMSFCFSKSFANCSSADLAEKSWKLATDVKHLRHFFSVYLNVNVHAVQQLDVNNLVCFRTVNQADHDVVLKSLFLLTRFETEKGIMLLVHGLDPSRLEDDFTTIAMVGKAEVWQDDFRWVLLEDEADGCRMSYGGLVLVEQPWEQFWLCEVLLIVLRWESAVVAPLFTLRCN